LLEICDTKRGRAPYRSCLSWSESTWGRTLRLVHRIGS